MKRFSVKEESKVYIKPYQTLDFFFFFLNHLFVYIKCLIVFLLIYIYIYHIACKNADLDLLLSKLEHETSQQQQ